MPGKQAKVLSSSNIRDLIALAANSRHPQRNVVMVLLSVKAGLRAAEIAKLTWPMVVDATGEIGMIIELRDRAAKRRSGRRLPIHPELRRVLQILAQFGGTDGHIIKSERGGPMRPISIVMWFKVAYRRLGLDGCSSHSGRRTFITNAARLVHKAGGSLRDVQLLAGHSSIETTQRYIDGDSDAQRKLVALL
jgi:integrase